ncbi:MAG: hypothetical protein WD468_12075 [Pirellulales bacterium]
MRPVQWRAAERLLMRRLGSMLAVVISFIWPYVAPQASHAQQGIQALQTGGQFGVMTQQQNGMVIQLPSAFRVSRKNGLSLTVDTRWASNYGYRPVEITVKSPKPTKSDHRVTIRFHSDWWSSQRGSVTVEQDFEMQKGSKSATALIACPQYQLATQSFWWDVWIDGVKDRDLSLDRKNQAMVAGTGMTPGGGNGLSMLAVGPSSAQRMLATTGTQEFEALSLPATEFPRRWIDYSCFDVISLSCGELQLLAQSNPSALPAIRHWVAAGGQLWISDAGARWENLAAISKTLAVPATILGLDTTETESQKIDPKNDAAGIAAVAESTVVAWQPVRFGRGGPFGRMVTFLDLTTGTTRVARDQATIDLLQNDPNFTVTDQTYPSNPEGRGRRWPRDSSRSFVDQPLGLGAFRAFRGDQQTIQFLATLPIVAVDPNAVGEVTRPPLTALQLALRTTRRWDTRHGMKPDEANADFPKLLVPDVGLAPVTEFQVLITLFVLAVGPANYWLLKRYNRLHLLVLTVPLAAVLLTSSLFAYAILSDGFGTTVRAQSVTTLDQRTGDAACWTRLSYYAGLVPGQGLTMPDDVTVYPIIPGWNDTGVDASIGAARELMWKGGEAKMTRGWLRSRTPMQYLTVRARKSPYRIELTPAAGKIRAVNQLGTKIHFLLVVDKHGQFFGGEQLANESKWVLEPITRVDAIRRFRQLFTDNQPEAPLALAGEDSDFQIIQRRQSRRMMSRQYGLQYSEQRLDANLLNDTLANLAGTSGEPALQLPPRSYVAVTETGSEVTLGISGAEEQASFHVLIGRW